MDRQACSIVTIPTGIAIIIAGKVETGATCITRDVSTERNFSSQLKPSWIVIRSWKYKIWQTKINIKIDRRKVGCLEVIGY
jgi:hypothetical protein